MSVNFLCFKSKSNNEVVDKKKESSLNNHTNGAVHVLETAPAIAPAIKFLYIKPLRVSSFG